MKASLSELPTTIEIPQITIINRKATVAPFKPTDVDMESGVVQELVANSEPLELGGRHLFLIHSTPPLPHHPDYTKHQVYWLTAQGKEIVPWHTDSWRKLSADTLFLDATDSHFSQMQESNPLLRMYFVYGFATQADIVKAKEYGGNIALRGSQSQYRAHIHVSEVIDNNTLTQLDTSHVAWLNGEQLKKMNGQLAFFLNSAGEKSMVHYKKILRTFGTQVEYGQMIGRNEPVFIKRTFFAFSSLSDALSAILACEDSVAATWLQHARVIGETNIQLAGEVIRLIQACKPCFTCIRPSLQDKILGGIDPKTEWLVAPFTLPLAQTMLNPGVLLKRAVAEVLRNK